MRNAALGAWIAFAVASLLLGPVSSGSENARYPKGDWVITQVYPVSDLAVGASDRDTFDPSTLIADITTSIDPKTWMIDVDPFCHEGFVILPPSTITIDDTRRALLIKTSVTNHRAIRSYLRGLRTAEPVRREANR